MKHQSSVDPSRLVFIDETWTKTNMAPLRGWGPRGERLPGKAPFGHWNTMTFLAALRHDCEPASKWASGEKQGNILKRLKKVAKRAGA